MRIIKKYSNRRLYDGTASAYLNLVELASLLRQGEEVRVVDAASGEDITRSVLLQVLLEDQGVVDALPVGLLHRMVRFGGQGQVARLVLPQLSVGLELLDAQLARMEEQLGWMRGTPGATPKAAPTSAAAGVEPAPAAAEPPPAADDLDALRARLAALEARLKRP